MTTSKRDGIAVAPERHSWHAGVVDAVQRAGGVVCDVAHSEALIWLGITDDLGAVLHPGIRWVQFPAAGVERWLEDGIITTERVFTSARGVYSHAVAEHVVALMLAISRRLHLLASTETWDKSAGEGRSLQNGAVGILGAGGIGRAVIRLLEPFQMRTLAITRSGREIPDATESMGVDQLDGVLPELDYLVISAPATSESRAIIGANELAKMPHDAWIINVARGTLVDTHSLVEALEAGTIGGAALDVTDPEPLPDGHPLWDHPNVLITPHVANPMAVARARFEEHVEANVGRYLRDEELLSVVDLESGY